MDIHEELNHIRRLAGLQEQARPMSEYVDRLLKLGIDLDVDGTGDEFQERLVEMGIFDPDTETVNLQELRLVYEEEAQELKHYLNMSEMPIWRAIQISHPDSVNWNNLGIYWSSNPNGAQVYAGNSGNITIIEARIKPEYVNWSDTIYLNFMASNESEIRTLDNVPVIIVAPINRKGYT